MPEVQSVISPCTQESVCEVPILSERQLDDSLARACNAFEHWRRVPLEARIDVLREGLQRFREAADRIAREVTMQMGKPISEAHAEVRTMFERAERSIADAKDALASEDLSSEGITRRVEHLPVGVILNIAAWNYPVIVPVNLIIPALLSGNTVLLKHSPQTPLTGIAYEDAFGRLSVPDLVTSLVATHEQVARVIRDDRVSQVSFTGSVRGGRAVYALAAERLIDAGLELGGKDPAYVAPDADLERAAAGLVEGACYNAGQSCCAIERAYVHADVFDELVERAAAAMRRLRPGDPGDPATLLGPVVGRAVLDRFDAQIRDAHERGARVVCGGERVADSRANLYPPTLVTGAPNDSLIMQEESFGPILPVARVGGDDEAVALMNDSRFGLTASVWTTDSQRAERIASRINAGTVYQNRCDYVDPALPWTGWGESGIGSTLSRYGFMHVTRRRSIHLRP